MWYDLILRYVRSEDVTIGIDTLNCLNEELLQFGRVLVQDLGDHFHCHLYANSNIMSWEYQKDYTGSKFSLQQS